MAHKPPTNWEIAALMDKVADIMEKQEANPFRVKAYRSGAKYVRTLDVSLADMVAAGDREGMEALPVIGEGLANLIFEYVRTGQSSLLKRLEGSWSPELMFEKVPGIGKTFAHRIAEKLTIKTLEELEHAAYDGTLASIEGFGKRRLEAVRTSLSGMLGARPAKTPLGAPPRGRARTSGSQVSPSAWPSASSGQGSTFSLRLPSTSS